MDEAALSPDLSTMNPAGGGVGAGRYAPSPTGDFHLGNLRTALLAWAFARQGRLRFLLRMEDLDERSRGEYEASQIADLQALGIEWDGPIIRQSERIEAYREAVARLEAAGVLYECYCTRRELASIASAPHRPPGSYPGTCRHVSAAERAAGRAKLEGTGRGPALRLAAGEGTERIADAICGPYEGAVDDFVIRRGDGVYSYNFTSVFDDGAEGVVQVVRGDDLLPSTPRQARLAQLLGFELPSWAHVPMVLNGEGARLAKRDGAVTMRELARYGWNAADIIQLIGQSLGVWGLRSASEFAEAVDIEYVRKLGGAGVWHVDAGALEAGPRAVLAE